LSVLVAKVGRDVICLPDTKEQFKNYLFSRHPSRKSFRRHCPATVPPNLFFCFPRRFCILKENHLYQQGSTTMKITFHGAAKTVKKMGTEPGFLEKG